jgi:hypothetical protein
MAKIRIKDLPKGQKISREELKKVKGGATPIIMPGASWGFSSSYARLPYYTGAPQIRTRISGPIATYADVW